MNWHIFTFPKQIYAVHASSRRNAEIAIEQDTMYQIRSFQNAEYSCLPDSPRLPDCVPVTCRFIRCENCYGYADYFDSRSHAERTKAYAEQYAEVVAAHRNGEYEPRPLINDW